MPRQVALSLFLCSDGEQPVAYARAVAPTRQRRQASDAVAALRDGAFAAAGLDYRTELASWLGPEIGLGLIATDPERPPDGWLLALRSRDADGARRFLQRFWQTRSLAGTDLQISSYRGMGLISGRGALPGADTAPLATALIDDDLVLIASGRGVLEQALDVSQLDELNLAASPVVRQAVQRLGRGAALLTAQGAGLSAGLGLPAMTDGELRTLVASLRPDGTSLELEGFLERSADVVPWLDRLDPQQGADLLSGLAADAASLAVIENPAGWPELLQPLLSGLLGPSAGPLPPLLLAADAGPLLWSQTAVGWLVGTAAEQPPPELLDQALARQGLIGAPLQLQDQAAVRVWTSLSAAGRGSRRNPQTPELQAELAGVRAMDRGLAWWAENLAVLAEQRTAHQPPRRRLAQLEELGLPSAPLRWAAGFGPAGELLQGWRPWRLLTALAAQPLTPSVQGLSLALEPDGANLHLKARLDLG